MQKTLGVAIRLFSAFAGGAILLSLFSLFQKALLGVEVFSLNPKDYIVPIVFGGGAGLALTIFYLRLRDSRAQLEDYLDNIDNLVQIVSADKRFLYVNKAWRDTLQYSSEEVKKLKLSDVLPPEGRVQCNLIFKRVFDGESVGEFEPVFIAKDGKRIHLRGTTNGSKDGEKRQKTRGIFRNITDSVEAEEFQRLSARIFENTQDGLLITTPERKISWVNQAFTKITGYHAEDVLGLDAKDFFSSETEDAGNDHHILRALAKGKNWQGEIWGKRKNGNLYPIEVSISVVYSKLGKVKNHIYLFSDISERKNNEIQLKQMAWRDPLTKLPNRIRFNQIVINAVEEGNQSANNVFAVFFLDLDGFKSVNDQYGHSTGDELLKLVARRLEGSIRQMDAVARLGGDEFGVVLHKTNEPKDVCKIAQTISDKIKAPYQIDEKEIHISTSIGISFYPDYKTLEDLINAADRAMYKAKADPNDNIYFAKEE